MKSKPSVLLEIIDCTKPSDKAVFVPFRFCSFWHGMAWHVYGDCCLRTSDGHHGCPGFFRLGGDRRGRRKGILLGVRQEL